MIKQPFVRWGLRLYLWQALVGLVAYLIVYRLLVDSLPHASLDGRISAEAWSDWWRKSSGDFAGVVPMVIGISVVYLSGYWYWLSRYLHDIAGASVSWSWFKISAIGIVQLILSLILIALPCFIVATMLGDPTQAVSERPFVQGITIASILGTIVAIGVGVPLVRTKYLLASTTMNWWTAIKAGYTYSLARSSRHLIVIVTAMALSIILWWVSSKVPSINGHSTGLVLLAAILYQAVMIARSLVRAWTIYSLADEVASTI